MILRVIVVLALAGWLAQARAAEIAATVKLSPSLTQVIKLVQSGVTEEVVLSYVENSALAKPNADDVIQLHAAGVSDRVLMALLSKRTAPSAPAAAGNLKNNGSEAARRVEAQAPTPRPQTTVYVQPPVYVQPAPAVAYAPSYYEYPSYSYPYYSYPSYYRYGYTWPAVSLGFSFGHHFFGRPFFGHHFGGHHGGLHFTRH